MSGPSNSVTVEDTETDEVRVVNSVRTVGNRTLFYRDKMWIDEEAAEEAKKSKPDYVEVKRFSDEYFDLVAKNTKAENAVLSQQQDNETLVVKLRGRVYRIR